jgi:hypothetical protein
VLDKISTRAVASMVVTALTAFEKKNRLLGMRYDCSSKIEILNEWYFFVVYIGLKKFHVLK